MKIIRRLSDGLVQYKTTEPHELTDKYYKSGGIKAIDINSITHEVIEDVTLPLNFRPGMFTYNNGIWEVIDQQALDNILNKIVLDNETNRYKKRSQDGADSYARLSAEFRLAKLSGIITEESQKIIEATLIPVRNEVLAGQWISGLQILESISDSIIGIDLYNRLWNLLNNYIKINY